MAIKSYVGSLETLKSEIVHVTCDNPLKIIIDTLTLEFRFINDNQDKSSHFKTEIEGTNKLIIKSVNFNNSLGEGLLAPINIGIYNGKSLYLSYFVWTPDEIQGKRIINYCLYTN